MASAVLRERPAWLLVGVGFALFVASTVHHTSELLALSGSLGPVLAFLLDSIPALALAYGGYRVAGSDLSRSAQLGVVGWSVLGSVLFVAVIGATFLIRVAEGRVVAEPVFPLLIAAEAGGLAGVVAGYYSGRAAASARRAEANSDVLAFVNDLLRHDLRNDLTVIRGHAEVMRAARPDGDDPTGNPGIVVDEVDNALERIETTRAIADTLLGEHEFEPVDLGALVRETARHVEDVHDVATTVEVDGDAKVVANDGLRSVVDNLLENAAEHNDADDPRIDVAVERVGETVRLTVRDNGPGLPGDLRSSLNDADATVDANGGLSIVETLVRGYGGRLRAGDVEPRGTEFVVELPAAAGAAD